jgi:hypothetical protein
MTAAGPWLSRSDQTEMGPLSEEQWPRMARAGQAVGAAEFDPDRKSVLSVPRYPYGTTEAVADRGELRRIDHRLRVHLFSPG